MIYNTKVEEQEEVLTSVENLANYGIVLYNDDVNTFDHVIECLIKYCKHDAVQAEQCSLLVHYKGKCVVKNGSVEELIPISDALCKEGLSALVEVM